jgi:hypothetical protein
MTTRGFREQRVAEIVAEFADAASGDADESVLMVVLAERLVEMLDVAAVGIALVGADGRLLPLVGKAVGSRGGQPEEMPAGGQRDGLIRVSDPAPAGKPGEPSEFRMRARGKVIGAITLVGQGAGGLTTAQRLVGQALADAAGSAILHRRELRRSEDLADQLQQALTSRIVIEQATGILAERWQMDVAESFRLLREHARAHNRKLHDVARSVVDGVSDPFEPSDRPARLIRDGLLREAARGEGV